jgi:hypothetical protein
MMRMHRLFVLVMVIQMAACSGEITGAALPGDEASGGGSPDAAGAPVDGDKRRDAGQRPVDGGGSPDAGVNPVDGGGNPDAGVGPVGGSPDAGAVAVDAGGGGGTATGGGAYFPTGSWFYTDVSGASPSPSTDAVIRSLRNAGGWGNGDRFQIDFSIDVLQADGSAKRSFTTTSDFFSPDCDHVPMPLPAGGNVEGESGYACVGDGDCHLIVSSPAEHRLYEMWRANVSGSTFFGGCLAVWDTSRAPTLGDGGRGLQCTSADAAGFPIAPLLFTADEVAAGEIPHAIRFILPNDRVRRGFVPPATHGTFTTGDTAAPFYGVHLRLRPDYPVDQLPSAGARVVARAMQRYGMYHADGGNIALTAQSDRHTTAKWAGLLGPRDLAALRVEDFQVIDQGAPINLTLDCTRTPLSN